MTFHVIIPARLASTRLPNKPLADIGGKPMVVRVAEQAQKSGAETIIVATDHPSIIDACRQHGIKAVLTRKDHQSGTDRIGEVAAKMDWPPSVAVVNVQGDEPLIDSQLIQKTASLITDTIPVATAAHLLEKVEDIFNPNYVKVVLNKDSQAKYFSRAAIPWYRNGYAKSEKHYPENQQAYRHIGLYAYRNDFLKTYSSLPVSPIELLESLEQLRILWHGYPIAVQITDTAPEAGVDTMEDLVRVRQRFLP